MYHKLTFFYILLPAVLIFQACGGGGSSSNSDNGDTDIVVGSAYVDLSWIAPTTRSDGGSLFSTSLAGYKIYYGTADNQLILLTDLQDPSLEEYRVSVPSDGDYYFAISAYDTYGLEGELSNTVFKNAATPVAN